MEPQHQTIVANLTGAVFNNAKLISVDLRQTDLANLHFEHSQIRMSHLDFANLRRAHLSYASLEGSSLVGADLRGSDLRHTFLGNVSFHRIDVIKYTSIYAKHYRVIIWKNSRADLRGVDLSETDGLTHQQLSPASVITNQWTKMPLHYWHLASTKYGLRFLPDKTVEHLVRSGPSSGKLGTLPLPTRSRNKPSNAIYPN